MDVQLLGFARGPPKILHGVLGSIFGLVENHCSSEIFALVIYFCIIYVRTFIIISFLKHLVVSWLYEVVSFLSGVFLQ